MASNLNGTGVTFSDATTQASAAISGQRVQRFTSSGTFTVPANVTSVKVSVVGGGGAGGGSATSGWGAPGGGAGGNLLAWVTGLTPGAAITVTTGTGGAGVANGNGGAGGASSFGSYATASGGAGGLRQVINTNGGVGGATSVSGPTVYYGVTGTTGGPAYDNGCSAVVSGFGGNSPQSVAGLGYALSTVGAGGASKGPGVISAGNPGLIYGGGGGGGITNAGPGNVAGGAGAAGVVIVEY